MSENTTLKPGLNALRAKRLGISTHFEPVAYLRADSPVCRSEGFETHTRINLSSPERTITATLNMVTDHFVEAGEVGLSDAAWSQLQAADGDRIVLSHSPAVDSLHHVRSKLYGHQLGRVGMQEIVGDIVAGRYSDIQLAAFVTACAGSRLDAREVTYLTEAMVNSGSRMQWQHPVVVDKHCIGGLPGNRTTPIVVAIVAANGLIMPKSSSRAITSPAGTADAIETMTRVTLSLDEMRSVVAKEGACMVWGGSVTLSPADDLLIRVERALDLDSEGQMVASVLSKKVAAGSTHVLIDIPVGPTAKVRSQSNARHLESVLTEVGAALGLTVQTLCSDGSQPVGVGIGPALEARDVLSVLRNEPDAPMDLRERALQLAAHILAMGRGMELASSLQLAAETLTSGRALQKFMAICMAQGGFYEPKTARYRYDVTATRDGFVAYINNRFVARLAKLAGAPADPAAGLSFYARLGERVARGDLLFSIHAEAEGQLNYAADFLKAHPAEIRVEKEFV